LDMAKEISMVEGNEKGREARKYFIAKEKEVQGLKLRNIDLEYKIQQNKEIQGLRNEIKAIRIETSYKENYATIVGYINITKAKIPYSVYSKLGRDASKQCREKGLKIGKVPDVKHGQVNAYPKEVLASVFKSYLG